MYEVCAKYRDASRGDADIRYRVERIARTELNRILFYAKEQSAIEDGDTNVLYQWSGPDDRRTTPMCRYMQTGELTGEDNKGRPYDYEYLRPQLPEWREQGRLLPDLKQMCVDVHDVFYNAGVIKTPMITDWQMHINCRHTFRRNHVITEGPLPEEVDGWIQIDNLPPFDPTAGITEPTKPEEPSNGSENPMNVQIVGDAVAQVDDEDDVEVIISENAEYTFGFKYSYNGVPTFYMPESDENDESAIFQFRSVDEFELGTWLRFYAEEIDAGLDDATIVEILTYESDLNYREIAYVQKNWDWLFLVADEFGWIQ